MRALIVDDDRAYAHGLAIVICETLPDATVDIDGFVTVGERADVHTWDYVLIDLSHPRTADPLADEFPGVRVAQHISESRGSRARPFIVVLTGESGVFTRPEVRRRLHEAHCEYFIHRTEFSENVSAILTPWGPRSGRLSASGRIVGEGSVLEPGGALNRFVEHYPASRLSTAKLRGQALHNELSRFAELLQARPRKVTKTRQLGAKAYRVIHDNAARINPRR